jgi:hypothetical protein
MKSAGICMNEHVHVIVATETNQNFHKARPTRNIPMKLNGK